MQVPGGASRVRGPIVQDTTLITWKQGCNSSRTYCWSMTPFRQRARFAKPTVPGNRDQVRVLRAPI